MEAHTPIGKGSASGVVVGGLELDGGWWGHLVSPKREFTWTITAANLNYKFQFDPRHIMALGCSSRRTNGDGSDV